jgi:hypothetical protein
MRRTSKRLEKQNAAYAARLRAVLEELGCVASDHIGYPYRINTLAGLLLVDVHTNECQPGAAVFTRFEKPKKAVKLLGENWPHVPSAHGVNPYTGKWNHHFFDETIEEAEAVIRREFARALGGRP